MFVGSGKLLFHRFYDSIETKQRISCWTTHISQQLGGETLGDGPHQRPGSLATFVLEVIHGDVPDHGPTETFLLDVRHLNGSG